MIYKLAQENLLAVFSCIFMIFFLAQNNSFEYQIKRFFWIATILVLVLIFVDSWEEVEAVKSYPTYGRIAASVIGYAIRPGLAYLVCRASLKSQKIKCDFWFALPLVINALVVVTAFFSPIAFSYDASNQFVRGPLGFSPFIVAGIYGMAICFISVMLISRGNVGDAAIVLFITAFLVLATVVETMFGFSALISGVASLGTIFYYLYLYINYSERDILTGAKVRRSFYLDVERSQSRIAAIISLDLNNLKLLNDTYGHRAGDKALQTLSKEAKETMPSEWRFYRTGGDEFMILCYKANEGQVQEFLKEFEEHMVQKHYSVAMGYVMYRSEMDFDKACHISDTMMYQNKRKMKELAENK